MHNETFEKTLRRIEENANLAAARQRNCTQVGPFRALLDPHTDMVWLNYAVPTAPLTDRRAAAAALDGLRDVFRQAGRKLRFEFTDALWPELPVLLEQAGLTLQARHPVMICTPGDFRPVAAPHVSVELVGPTDDGSRFELFADLQRRGFELPPGESAPLTDVAEFRQRLRDGLQQAAIATFAGTPAGAGVTLVTDEICELAGVSTVPEFRRRGVAATLSSVLAGAHFARRGTCVWLSAGDAAAEAVYAKIGFRQAQARLNYIEEPG